MDGGVNMNRKILAKIVALQMIFFIFASSFCTVKADTLSNMVSQTQNFINEGKANAPDVGDTVNSIFDIGSILTTLGVAVMLGATAYMGIKYLTSGPEAKAKLKVQLIGLVVAGIVIFGSYYIWKTVIEFASSL